MLFLMMKKQSAMKNSALLLVFFMLASCSGVKVLNTEANDGFALGNYKTFDFYKLEARGDTVAANYETNAELLKQAIAKQLQAKGLQQATSNPSLLVNIGVVVEEKIQTRETSIREAPVYMG